MRIEGDIPIEMLYWLENHCAMATRRAIIYKGIEEVQRQDEFNMLLLGIAMQCGFGK